MPPRDIAIRAALPADVPALFEIERRSFGQSHWEAESFLRYDCVALFADGVAVGFLISRLVFSSTSDRGGEREILNLAVDPAWRGRGFGRLLLQAELKGGGIHFLEVRESNTAARKLYESEGFRQVGMRKEYYDEPLESAIIMRREDLQTGLEREL